MFKKFRSRRASSAAQDVPPPLLCAIDDRPSTVGNVAQFTEEPPQPEDVAALEGIDFDGTFVPFANPSHGLLVDVNAVDMVIEAAPNVDKANVWNGCGGCPVSDIGGDFVPPRFEFGCSKNANLRWASTLQWREIHRIDHILNTPRIHFKTIKANWNHFFCARTRTDNKNLVVYEHVGGLNKALATLETEHDISFADVMAHYLFLTEFQWTQLDTRPFDPKHPTVGQMVKILDFSGMALSDCKNADFRTFVSWTMRTIGQHYPERCAAIYMINTPSWFSTFWLVIQRLISDVTKQKIRICPAPKDYVRRLTAWLGQPNLPVILGGELQVDGVNHLSHDETILHNFVNERLVQA
ncbi:hypothetical protein THRCLA_01072 [Thraustotheca clavata]|uniref:CRAL-TRIO domain-containing protein n=1 Tax=Thraustotheca clavata TaxID=74557 RepID=A0A1W0A9E1_9STRA|nr:hypothetical protein THRCLA_01072 [Thraustotheca clavata]